MSSPVLVNLGCGNVWHSAWRNFDLDPQHPSVEALDLAASLPLATASVDVVYHAHVLEHLQLEAGRVFLTECLRVLKPGGTVRVVVPDLQGAAERYLAALASGDDLEYEWSVLELIDQMVRSRPQGEMGRFLRRLDWRDHPRVRARIGTDMDPSQPTAAPSPRRHRRPARALSRIRFALARLWLSPRERNCTRDAQFRAQGEIHRWMYDRRSLARTLSTAGFAEPVTHSATTSRIPGFTDYALDVTSDGWTRHPDSLYMEAIRR